MRELKRLHNFLCERSKQEIEISLRIFRNDCGLFKKGTMSSDERLTTFRMKRVVLLPDSGFSFSRRDGVGNAELCPCQFVCVLGHSLLYLQRITSLRKDLLSHAGHCTSRQCFVTPLRDLHKVSVSAADLRFVRKTSRERLTLLSSVVPPG